MNIRNGGSVLLSCYSALCSGREQGECSEVQRTVFNNSNSPGEIFPIKIETLLAFSGDTYHSH